MSRIDVGVDRSQVAPGPAWGWFVALGAGLVLLGLLALSNLALATTASVFFVGIMMIVGGVAHVIHAFRVRLWGGFLWWLLAGVLYVVAGFFALSNPLLAAATLTLVFAITLIVAGVVRIASGFGFRPVPGWGWVITSGVITTLAGLVFLLGWPVNSLWLLGMVLAIDLLFQGIAAISFGLQLRPHVRPPGAGRPSVA